MKKQEVKSHKAKGRFPSATQVHFFKQAELDPPPSRTACDLTIRFIKQGFPAHGHLTEKERMDMYRDGWNCFMGKRVTFTEEVHGNITIRRGTVKCIRGKTLFEANKSLLEAKKYKKGLSPLVVIVGDLDGRPAVQTLLRDLHIVRLIES